MQQIKLSEFTESYAVSIEDALPENEAVFFKLNSGETYRGEFFREEPRWGNHFDNLKGSIFGIWEVNKWHPVTVDL